MVGAATADKVETNRPLWQRGREGMAARAAQEV